MARASRKDAERHKAEIVEAAARLFRARGVDGVSVPELMAEAGLTHGGFYGHFASKEALAAEAFAAAFAAMEGHIDGVAAPHGGHGPAALDAVVADYLSTRHRDHPESGCPSAALIDVGRESFSDAARATYAAGVAGMLARLEAVEGSREAALATLSTLVGALLLARATRGTALSEAFLAAGRDSLAEGQGSVGAEAPRS